MEAEPGDVDSRINQRSEPKTHQETQSSMWPREPKVSRIEDSMEIKASKTQQEFNAQGLTPLISVIIPAYNEEKYIRDCLQPILAQDIDSRLREVIVVDNASSDQTAVIAQDVGAKVVREERKGKVHALIRGTEESRGEILVFTDADSKPPSDWLSKIKRSFDRNPELDAVGGVLSFPEARPFYQQIAEFWQRNPSDLMGANMAIRRSSLEKIGGFDPSVNFGEDVWISLRLKAIGGKILIDKNNVVETSARRFSGNFLSDLWKAVKQNLNYLSLKLRGKPLYSTFEDIRKNER